MMILQNSLKMLSALHQRLVPTTIEVRPGQNNTYNLHLEQNYFLVAYN